MRRIVVGYLLATVLSVGVALAQSGYLQPFDGTPATPQPYPAVPGLAAWDVTVHSRDGTTWTQLEAMDASHGPDCAGPPAMHHLAGAYADSVFACNNHIMTSILAGGYGVIYLTPPVVADWTDTPAVIQWDMSTARTSTRDWVDLWVSPFDEHLQLPLEGWLPDLNGNPRRAVKLRMDMFNGTDTIFRGSRIDNFVETALDSVWWAGYEGFLVGGTSAARRDTFQLTLSRTHLRFGMPAYNFWWVDADLADLGWTQGVVQLGHHSYNPGKDCALPSGVCTPNTWHWDNVSVSPSRPFTITRAQQEYVNQATASAVTFPTPAQAGDHLRFVANGNAVEVSLDQGATWQPATLQPAEKSDPSSAQNYWMPVPAGTQRVDIRAQGGWWGSTWLARDMSLWSQILPTAPRTPTPTVVVPPTATRTPTPLPTVTPGATATEVPTPTLPPTVTPTSITAPTATPTRPPRCGRIDTINGGQVYTPLPDAQCMQ